jgi:predicted nucleotidyltransferase
VREFAREKLRIFGSLPRGPSCLESKISDVLYEEVLRAEAGDWSEAKSVVDELLRRAVELADKCGFVKVIYDFALIAAGRYRDDLEG